MVAGLLMIGVLHAGDRSLAQPSAKPLVVVTTSVLCDQTRQIAQDTIDLKCLMAAGDDPHVYQAKPEDRQAIEQASLILYAGYDLEPRLIRLIRATSNSAPKVAVSEVAVPEPIQSGHSHSHGDGHSHGFGSSAIDPHVFHSADNGVKMVSVVRQRLIQLQPSHTSKYTQNAQSLTQELTQIHRWIRTQVQTIPFKQRWIVSTHDSFEYYARTYNLGNAPTLQSISTEEKPTAFRVAQMVRDLKILAVPVIFAEMTVNPKLITAVAQAAKVKVSDRRLFADGLGAPGSEADTYPKMLIANTRTIVEGLGGRYTPFRLNRIALGQSQRSSDSGDSGKKKVASASFTGERLR
jgi:manganese/iron transport system substrate-binding protein